MDLFIICKLLNLIEFRIEFLEIKKIVIVGDILYFRVVWFNIWSLIVFGVEVYLVGIFILLFKYFGEFGKLRFLKLFVYWDIELVLEKVDFVMILCL